MKGLLSFAAVALLSGFALSWIQPEPMAAAPRTTEASAADYKIDGGHSTVLFKTKHLGVAHFYGRFNDVQGTLVHDESDAATSSVAVTIDAASIDTNSKGRDDHLKSPDFFSVKEFPTITFKSTKVEKKGEHELTITGDLTLRGVTKSIQVDALHVGSGPDPWGGTRAGFETTFTIDPRDYEFQWMAENEGALGPDVQLTISLEATKS